jgi:low molecular weight phosphotyrosine protein phosphatase
MANDRISVLFVCLGNICRSTMGEGVLSHLAKQPAYASLLGRVDSCGTGAYHIGSEPDSRTMRTLTEHGVTEYSHAARQLKAKDFTEFDYIFAMDRDNLTDTLRVQARAAKAAGDKASLKAKVGLFGEYSGGTVEEVEDPYFGGREGFEVAYQQCARFAKNFLEEMRRVREQGGRLPSPEPVEGGPGLTTVASEETDGKL